MSSNEKIDYPELFVLDDNSKENIQKLFDYVDAYCDQIDKQENRTANTN